jgi:hypothetical protein
MTKLFFDGRCFFCGCFFLLVLSCRCFSGESNTAVAPFEVLSKRIDAAIKFAETNEIARSNSDVRSQTILYATQLINTINRQGDRAALPFLQEKSLNAANPEIVRERSAEAYVNIANVEESSEFMRKIFRINDKEGYWRDTIAPLFLEKVEAAIANRSISDEVLTRVLSLLVAYAQSPANAQEADYVDVFLVKHCAGYQTSIQRMAMAKSFSDGLNDLEKKHFLPIKESVEALPKKQRVDLRKRFPDLPPLPGEKNAGMPLKTTLAIGATLVAFFAVCAAIWLAAKRKKSQP